MNYVGVYEQLIQACKNALDVGRATYNTGMRRDDVMRLLIGELEAVLKETERLSASIPRPGSLEYEMDQAQRMKPHKGAKP